MTQPKVVDLFSGVGGFSLGFEQAGFDVALAIDDHEITLDTYKKNFPETTAEQLDLADASRREILDLLPVGKEEIDVVIGGPPCQGFSFMGNQDPDDPRNELLERFGEHVVSINPDYFVAENVTGLLSDVGKEYLSRFMEIVNSGGYNVVRPVRTLDAANFGVPQNRERVIILGYKSGIAPPQYPDSSVHDNSVSDALGDLPDSLLSANIDNGVYRDGLDDPSEYVVELNGWRNTPENTDGITGLEPVSHTDRVRNRFATVEPGESDDVSHFHRLHPEEKSNTLRAGSSRDRGTHTPARPIHPSAPRCITVREAARLQSFPDWFEFHQTKYHGLRQIGNSVPPLLAKHIGEELISHISN